MADQFIYLMTDTWNSGATDFAGIHLDVTDSASAAASRLIDLKINGASKFKVQKDGSVTQNSTDAGATAGPLLTLYRNSASPAANDLIGQLLFQGEDSAGNAEDYAKITARIDDPTSTSEDATLIFSLPLAGSMKDIVSISGTSTLSVFSDDATNSVGPALALTRNSASPAAGDAMGAVEFYGKDTAANTQMYGRVFASITDPTSGSEDSTVNIQTFAAGANGNALIISQGSTTASGQFSAPRVNGFKFIEENSGISANSANLVQCFVVGGLAWTADSAGALTVQGNIVAFSDERFKKDWSDLDDDFLDRLSVIKSGTYSRTDLDLRQVGVSAQDLQQALPEAVVTDADGNLAVAYGQAALVSVVKLTQEVKRLKWELNL